MSGVAVQTLQRKARNYSILNKQNTLFAEPPEDQGDNNTYDDTGCYRHKETKIVAIDDNIARETSKRNLLKPWPEKTDYYDDNAYCDEVLIHSVHLRRVQSIYQLYLTPLSRLISKNQQRLPAVLNHMGDSTDTRNIQVIFQNTS